MENVKLWILRVLYQGYIGISITFGKKQNDHLHVKVLGYMFNIVYTFEYIPTKIL